MKRVAWYRQSWKATSRIIEGCTLVINGLWSRLDPSLFILFVESWPDDEAPISGGLKAERQWLEEVRVDRRPERVRDFSSSGGYRVLVFLFWIHFGLGRGNFFLFFPFERFLLSPVMMTLQIWNSSSTWFGSKPDASKGLKNLSGVDIVLVAEPLVKTVMTTTTPPAWTSGNSIAAFPLAAARSPGSDWCPSSTLPTCTTIRNGEWCPSSTWPTCMRPWLGGAQALLCQHVRDDEWLWEETAIGAHESHGRSCCRREPFVSVRRLHQRVPYQANPENCRDLFTPQWQGVHSSLMWRLAATTLRGGRCERTNWSYQSLLKYVNIMPKLVLSAIVEICQHHAKMLKSQCWRSNFFSQKFWSQRWMARLLRWFSADIWAGDDFCKWLRINNWTNEMMNDNLK